MELATSAVLNKSDTWAFNNEQKVKWNKNFIDVVQVSRAFTTSVRRNYTVEELHKKIEDSISY